MNAHNIRSIDEYRQYRMPRRLTEDEADIVLYDPSKFDGYLVAEAHDIRRARLRSVQTKINEHQIAADRAYHPVTIAFAAIASLTIAAGLLYWVAL